MEMPVASAFKTPKRVMTEMRLISAVGTILECEGFEALTIPRVCEVSNAASPLIYRYFGGLDGLFDAYLEQEPPMIAGDDFIQEMGEADFVALPLREKIRRLLHVTLGELIRRPVVGKLLVRELSSGNKFADRVEEYRKQRVRSFIQAMQDAYITAPADTDPALEVVILLDGVILFAIRQTVHQDYHGQEFVINNNWSRVQAVIDSLVDRLFGN